MQADRRDKPTQSLGELVLDLEAGAACPWCGGNLEAVRAARLTSASGPVEDECLVDVPILSCAECGCEVYLAGSGSRGARPRHLGAAA